jgi:hypothetical protein
MIVKLLLATAIGVDYYVSPDWWHFFVLLGLMAAWSLVRVRVRMV